MIHKEFKTANKKVIVYRQKNYVAPGYEYYITVLTLNNFNGWIVSESYKQKLSIYSEKLAFKIANDFLTNNV